MNEAITFHTWWWAEKQTRFLFLAAADSIAVVVVWAGRRQGWRWAASSRRWWRLKLLCLWMGINWWEVRDKRQTGERCWRHTFKISINIKGKMEGRKGIDSTFCITKRCKRDMSLLSSSLFFSLLQTWLKGDEDNDTYIKRWRDEEKQRHEYKGPKNIHWGHQMHLLLVRQWHPRWWWLKKRRMKPATISCRHVLQARKGWQEESTVYSQ